MSAIAALVGSVIKFADHVHGISSLDLRAALAEERLRLAEGGTDLPLWWQQLEDLTRAVRLSSVHDRFCEVCGHYHVAINVNRRLLDESVDLPAPADDAPDPHFVGLCGICFKAFRAQRRTSCALQ